MNQRTSARHIAFRQILLRQIIIGSILTIIVALLFSACRYYKVNQIDPLNDVVVVEEVKKKDKYVILHQGGSAFHLNGIVVNDSARILYGTLEPLPFAHLNYQKDRRDGQANAYGRASKEDSPLFEVHIYTSNVNLKFNTPTPIPFDAVEKLEVHDRHVGATVASITAISLVSAAAVVLIIAATKSSCPFVYVEHGDSYRFTGEMFAGAIYPSLERDDYMPLPPLQATENQYQLLISNELLERQYTNLANLVAVHHEQNTQVLFDNDGAVHTIGAPIPPSLALSGSTHYEKEIATKDQLAFLFDDPDQDDLSNITLSFNKPTNANSGKLVLSAKNSFWLDYTFGKMNEQFGTYYNSFAEKQRKEPAGKLSQWGLDQGIPLSVYLQTNKGWKLVDHFKSVGPLASRDIVMPIDLSDVGGTTVKIKLQCGFMFWEVDYAAMDFTENVPVVVENITASSAIDENGNDVADQVAATDDKYLEQPEIGNVVTATFPVAHKPSEEKISSFFLHSRGYYEYIRDYKNSPNFPFLLSIKNKGAFPEFSREMYQRLISNDQLYAAALTNSNEN
jgi:hypothetical protein